MARQRRRTWAAVLSRRTPVWAKRLPFRKNPNRPKSPTSKNDGDAVQQEGRPQKRLSLFRKNPNRPKSSPTSKSDDVAGKQEGRPQLTDFYEVSKEVIGRGHYATVVRARNKRTGAWVAVKRIKIKSSRKEALKREIEVLARVGDHPNIVTLHDIFVTDTEVQLVMELLAGGELFDRLVSHGPMDELQASHHIRKIGLALQFLHERGIVHRDLKPENLILTSKANDAEMMIADFGLSKVVDDEHSTMRTLCGTWAYSAPEVNRSRAPGATIGHYTAKVDIWSCGVIMFMILGGYHPFDVNGDRDDSELWHSIVRGEFNFDDPAWNGISAGARDLLKKLIVVDPEQRYSTAEMLNHPWILQSGPAPHRSRAHSSRRRSAPSKSLSAVTA